MCGGLLGLVLMMITVTLDLKVMAKARGQERKVKEQGSLMASIGAHLESHLSFKEERQLPPKVTSFALAITFKAAQEPHQEGLVRRANMCVVNVKALIIAFRLARTRANDSLS